MSNYPSRLERIIQALRKIHVKEEKNPKLVHILKIAASIIADKGYHNTSIRDISRASGMSLAGLYYYVKNKEELLFLISRHAFDSILASLTSQLPLIGDGRQRLTFIIQTHLTYFLGNLPEVKVLAHESDSLKGRYHELIAATKKNYADLLFNVLSEIEGKREEIDLRVATFALFGMMNWIYTWYNPRRDRDIQRLAKNMTEIFLHGFLKERQPLMNPGLLPPPCP